MAFVRSPAGSIRSLLFFVIAASVCGGCNDSWEKHFSNLEAARSAHLMEKGWIPAFVSADAKNISLTGDQDAASVYGSYTSADAVLLRKHCTEVDTSFRVPAYGPKWFYDEVRKSGTASQLRSRGYDVLHCDEGDFNVVLISSRQDVYFWSARR